MVHWADPGDVADEAAGWTQAVLNCRSYGHAWMPSTVIRSGSGFTIRQRCSRRCGSERETVMDSRGYTHGWRMTYREGYLMKHLGRVDQEGRAIIRLASIRNMTILEVDEG